MTTVSVLYREPKLLKARVRYQRAQPLDVSVLYRESKLLKVDNLTNETANESRVSVLYREPKLLKGTRPAMATPIKIPV
ncbi:MAG: hypothetical protein N2385_14785, partial [Chloroflexus sp.]|nr:hypothetical protein [Chloroflexus sp.]